MRALIILLLSAGLLVTGLPLPKWGSQQHAGLIVAALADDDDDGDGGGGGGNDDDGDDDNGDDDDDGPAGDDDDDGDGDAGTLFGGGFGAGSDDRYEATREILAIDADPALIRDLEADGFVVRDRRSLSALQVSVSRLAIPPGLSLTSALARARQVAPGVAYEPNPVYQLASAESEPVETAQLPCTGADCYALDLVGWPSDAYQCGQGLRVGMTDTAVDPRHPALRGQALSRQRFAPAGLEAASPDDHGTAVAALLVGNPSSGFSGMLPSASLFAADVFHLDRTGQPQATLADLVNGLDWLAEQRVSVINISMTGPPNPLLEAAVDILDRRGIGVVSAAGNGGPAAAPVFPAAYDSVVSVTAVDQGLRPFRLANQGDYIVFASPGVEVWSAAEGGAGRYRTGTSVAAAHVTGAIAESIGRGNSVDSAIRILRNQARDLGAPGRDRVFGWGLLQTSPNCG